MGKLEQIDAAGGVAIAHIFPHVGHISKEQRGPLAGQRAALFLADMAHMREDVRYRHAARRVYLFQLTHALLPRCRLSTIATRFRAVWPLPDAPALPLRVGAALPGAVADGLPSAVPHRGRRPYFPRGRR